MKRREFLMSTMLVCFCGCSNKGIAGQSVLGGCVFAARGMAIDSKTAVIAGTEIEYETRTGNIETDRIISRYLFDIREYFNVSPGVAIYDDSGDPNAFASTGEIQPNTKNSIFLGKNLLSLHLRDKFGVAALRALIAHEVGHIYQINHGMIERLRRPTDIGIELHADVLTGWYLGALKEPMDKQLLYYGVGKVWETLGSSSYNARDSHGTAKQRMNAITYGYSLSYEYKIPVHKAAEQAIGGIGKIIDSL